MSALTAETAEVMVKMKSDIRSLTEVRGAAAVIIVIYHFGKCRLDPSSSVTVWSVPHGYLAVDMFFMLSGFLDELWNGIDEIRRPPVAIFSSSSLLEIARFRLLAYSGQMIHRRHHNAFLIALGLLLGFCGGTTAQAATPAELISSFRLQHGEGKVRIDPTLNRIAHAQAAAMAAKDMLDHDVLGPFSSRVAPFGSKRAAENIAFGYDSFPKTLDQWIGSSGHRSNLLMHGATRVGVGSAKSSKTVRTYWAMVIAEERPKQAKQEATKLRNKLDESCQVKLVNLCLY